MRYYIDTFASAYGSCAYGDSGFNNTSSTCATGTSTGSSAGGDTEGGVLANTGFDIVLAASIACVIIFAALVVRFVRKKPAHTTPGN